MAKLEAPADVTSVTVGGKQVEVRDGFVEVAEADVKALLRHGFAVVKDVERAVKRAELHISRKA